MPKATGLGTRLGAPGTSLRMRSTVSGSVYAVTKTIGDFA